MGSLLQQALRRRDEEQGLIAPTSEAQATLDEQRSAALTQKIRCSGGCGRLLTEASSGKGICSACRRKRIAEVVEGRRQEQEQVQHQEPATQEDAMGAAGNAGQPGPVEAAPQAPPPVPVPVPPSAPRKRNRRLRREKRLSRNDVEALFGLLLLAALGAGARGR